MSLATKKIAVLDIIMSREFRLPVALLVIIIIAVVFRWPSAYGIAIVAGIVELALESWQRIRIGKWNLDYLALITLITAFVIGQLLAGAVIALMVSISTALEQYGTAQAEKTLRGLFEMIPKSVLVRLKDGNTIEKPIQEAQAGDIIIIRPNEMLPIDGYLVSSRALFNESNLTGEIEPADYVEGALIKSGLVNVGETIEIKAQGDLEHSSYRKILDLVEEGKTHPAPAIRLAERYNVYFTIFSLTLAFSAYFFSGDWERFLAVLVIATPCPLLIAAPISFIGGLNKAARRNIIVKSPFVLELLAKTKVLFFDKTGTLTLGEPKLKRIELFDEHLDRDAALSIAAAIEWHSFHPIAKSFVKAHTEHGEERFFATEVEERIGEGIFGTIEGERYGIVKSQAKGISGIAVDLTWRNRSIARFFFDDELKSDVGAVFDYLRERGYNLGIITGDKKQNAERLFGHFKLPIYAGASPETKAELIRKYQRRNDLVGMVGDGMNDAPALALADIGIVFSGTENSASIEAADVAILGRDAWLIRDAVHIGRRSYSVALQSILIGIGLSAGCMICASFGFIAPVYGAILQELIDAIVIVNALRSTY